MFDFLLWLGGFCIGMGVAGLLAIPVKSYFYDQFNLKKAKEAQEEKERTLRNIETWIDHFKLESKHTGKPVDELIAEKKRRTEEMDKEKADTRERGLKLYESGNYHFLRDF